MSDNKTVQSVLHDFNNTSSLKEIEESEEKKILQYYLFGITNKSKRPLTPLLGETDKCAHWLFCKKFNAQQLLYEAFFNIMCISALNLKVSLLSHFGKI